MNSLVEDMTKIKEEFYASSGKKIFMKKDQKEKIAETINSKISLEDLIRNTMYLIPSTNCIYVDYLIFKNYAMSSNYQFNIDSLVELMITTVNNYSSFQIHINLSTLTITALERFQSIFRMYYDTCIRRGLLYDSRIIDQIVIYNTPSIISSISKLIVNYTEPAIKKKMIFHYKDVSENLLHSLLN